MLLTPEVITEIRNLVREQGYFRTEKEDTTGENKSVQYFLKTFVTNNGGDGSVVNARAVKEIFSQHPDLKGIKRGGPGVTRVRKATNKFSFTFAQEGTEDVTEDVADQADGTSPGPGTNVEMADPVAQESPEPAFADVEDDPFA